MAVFSPNDTAAKKDGARILATYERSIVWGEFQSFYDSSIDERQYTNADYYYYVDDARVAALQPQMEILDSMVASIYPRMKLYLMAAPPKAGAEAGAPTPPAAGRVSTESLPRPDWAGKSSFESDGRIYGVGACDAIGSIPAVWTKAEENAIFELLTFQSARIGSITTQSQGSGSGSMAHMELIKLTYRMEGLRVSARWLDGPGARAYVLVSAPMAGIRRINE
ncbi:MAG TPA: hypothetical protein VIO60_05610 [Rectinemataceae bacterium]